MNIVITDFTTTDIDQLRTVMDNLPLNPYAPMLTKVLKSLPHLVSAPVGLAQVVACSDTLADQIQKITARHQEQMQREIERVRSESKSFDQMFDEWMSAPLGIRQ
jgi:hypothetical protein